MDKSLKQVELSAPEDTAAEVTTVASDAAPSRWRSISNRVMTWGRFAAQRDFWLYLWEQFRRDDGFQQAGVMSYTSLLALVPLMAVVLGVVSAFPAFGNWSDTIQDFIFQNFVPAAGETVQKHLQQFVGNAQVLTGPGALFLVITALLLMSNIERAFNRIWRVEQARPIGSRILVYWAVLTLGPMLLGGSLAMTSIIAGWQSSDSVVWLSGIVGWLLKRAPFFVAAIGFMLMYFVIPNRRVPLSSAVLSGIVAALLFEAAKSGFVWYVKTFPTYEKLYGALAVIPVFLVWIYVTWLVTFFGVILSAVLSRFRSTTTMEDWGQRMDFVLAYRLLYLLWRAQCRGHSLNERELVKQLPANSVKRFGRVLEALLQSGWVCLTTDEDVVLAVDTEFFTLEDLYSLAAFVLPIELTPEAQADVVERPLVMAMADIRKQSETQMKRNLKSYFLATEELAATAQD